MIHDIFPGKTGGRPIANLCDLILAECLSSGATAIRVSPGEPEQGLDAVAVRYLVEGEWRQVMKIPSQAGLPLFAHLRSMCDVDPVHHPKQEGTFNIRTPDREASVVATFGKTETGEDEVELRLTGDAPPVDG
jgi:type II secretory ATPase GspE/PulE/Tfp pilus assembly ATPase PilB-like protein